MKTRYAEVSIYPHHAGFGMWQRQSEAPSWKEGWESREDLVTEIRNELATPIYELGVDQLPEGLKDIQGRIYNEPDWVYGYLITEEIGGEVVEEAGYFGIEKMTR